MFKRAFLAGVLFFCGSTFAANYDQPTLVQSYPLETELNNSDIAMTSDVWLDLINSAEHTIDLEQLFLGSTPDQALEPIIVALERAAHRGVVIRLLLSDKMGDEDPVTLKRLKLLPHFETRKVTFANGIQHAKFWIVDGKTIFVGSQNFDWRSLTHIQELGVVVTNKNLTSKLMSIFEMDWARAGGANANEPALFKKSELSYFEQGSVELVGSPANQLPSNIRPAIDSLKDLLMSAKKSIRIQLLDYGIERSFSNDTRSWLAIDTALRKAAARGVKVELVLSHWSASNARSLKDLKSLARVENVSVKIVTVPQYSSGPIEYGRVIHGKYAVIDGKILWVGTSNWSYNYFQFARNIELVISIPNLAAQCDQLLTKVSTATYTEVVNSRTHLRKK